MIRNHLSARHPLVQDTLYPIKQRVMHKRIKLKRKQIVRRSNTSTYMVSSAFDMQAHAWLCMCALDRYANVCVWFDMGSFWAEQLLSRYEVVNKQDCHLIIATLNSLLTCTVLMDSLMGMCANGCRIR